uniref:ADP-ribosylation factor-related protein 1 n=4 Tax=Equus TaxID=9789 RepID=A0A9L0TJD8_HORSE
LPRICFKTGPGTRRAGRADGRGRERRTAGGRALQLHGESATSRAPSPHRRACALLLYPRPRRPSGQARGPRRLPAALLEAAAALQEERAGLERAVRGVEVEHAHARRAARRRLGAHHHGAVVLQRAPRAAVGRAHRAPAQRGAGLPAGLGPRRAGLGPGLALGLGLRPLRGLGGGLREGRALGLVLRRALAVQRGQQLALPDGRQAGLRERDQLAEVPLQPAQVGQLGGVQAGAQGPLHLPQLRAVGLQGGLQAVLVHPEGARPWGAARVVAGGARVLVGAVARGLAAGSPGSSGSGPDAGVGPGAGAAGREAGEPAGACAGGRGALRTPSGPPAEPGAARGPAAGSRRQAGSGAQLQAEEPPPAPSGLGVAAGRAPSAPRPRLRAPPGHREPAASPARAAWRPASALTADPRFLPSAAATGSAWRGGRRDGSAPFRTPGPATRRAQRGVSGSARVRGVRLGGPRAQVGGLGLRLPGGPEASARTGGRGSAVAAAGPRAPETGVRAGREAPHTMYTLLSGLYKYMFQKDEYCILILGLDNAGKTTFLEQSKTRFNKNYKGMSLSKITTTVGLNIGTVDVGKSRLLFWDLGGQEELQSLWDKYYAECHGVIYVIDSTDEERLSESKQAFEKMVTSEALDGVPILVLANKQDIETCLSIPDIKTAFSDCTSKIGRRDCLTQACSALTGKGVREGIEWMVKCVVRNVHRPPRQRDIT